MRVLKIVAVPALLALIVAGCATSAARQYEEAHKRYMEAVDNVTQIEAQLAKAKLDGNESMATSQSEALDVAKRVVEDAQVIRAETRDDAERESESNHAMWITVLGVLGAGVKVFAGLGSKAADVAV